MKRFPVLCKFVPDNIINPKMSTLERIIRDYDKDIVLKDCQRKAFEYLFVIWSRVWNYFLDVYRDWERQAPITLYERLGRGSNRVWGGWCEWSGFFFCCKNSRRDIGLKLGAESLLMVYTSPLFSKFPSDIINLLLDHKITIHSCRPVLFWQLEFYHIPYAPWGFLRVPSNAVEFFSLVPLKFTSTLWHRGSHFGSHRGTVEVTVEHRGSHCGTPC